MWISEEDKTKSSGMYCCVVSEVLGVSQGRNTFLRHSLNFHKDTFSKCCLTVQELSREEFIFSV